jgi:hypothetical protein
MKSKISAIIAFYLNITLVRFELIEGFRERDGLRRDVINRPASAPIIFRSLDVCEHRLRLALVLA